MLSLVVMVVVATSTLAQSPASELTKDAERIRKGVVSYGVGHRITATLKGGATYHGAVGMLDDTTFQVAEVDLKRVVTINYNDVKKVQDDYGGKNIYGKRINPRTSRIVVFSVLGALFALIVLSIPKT